MNEISSSWNNEGFQLEEYRPPEWAKHFKYIPKHRVKLAQLPTPIHKWNIPNIPKEFEVFIKRDDMTGSTLSGNKVRKLEFSLAEALQRGCKDVITTGDIQSNHCRTTSIAARQLGLQAHLVIKTNIQIKHPDEVPCTGNMFLNRMAGAKIYFFKTDAQFGNDVKKKIKEIADNIRADTGREAYTLPRGGSGLDGLYGYIETYNEMIQQGLLDNITDIVLCCGSTGSLAGIAIANYVVSGDKIRIHGYKISNFDAEYTYNHVAESLEFLGLKGVQANKLFDLNEKYIGEGYAATTRQQLEFMTEVSTSTGIILDPTYTGKCAYGMVCEMRSNPHVFKGRRVLFIHTGGIFGGLHGEMDEVLKTPGGATNRCYIST